MIVLSALSSQACSGVLGAYCRSQDYDVDHPMESEWRHDSVGAAFINVQAVRSIAGAFYVC